MLASSSNSSEWNTDDKWSSQVWKSDEMLGTRTGNLYQTNRSSTLIWTQTPPQNRTFSIRMKQSHAEFGSEANEFGQEANEFEIELLKSGSESMIGRMQTGYFIVEQNAANLETERMVMT